MNTKEKINNLELSRITVDNIEDRSDYELVTILGGFNGSSMWNVYLEQIKEIMNLFKDCWLIDLTNDCLDDLWKLRIGIRK